MGIHSSERNTPHTLWRGYGKPCGVVYNQRNAVMNKTEESVVSYRGKRLTVKVGNKSRKAFHEFRRWKYSCNMTDGYWCGLPENIWANDYHYLIYRSQLMDVLEHGGTSTYIGGDRIPSISPLGLQSLGEPYRDLVISDMFTKVNSPRFDAVVFLAEIGETLTSVRKLLTNAAKSMIKAKVAVRNTKYLTSNPHEVWLWVRYELLPTMMDVEDLLKAIKPQLKIDRVQDGDRSTDPITIAGTAKLLKPVCFNRYEWDLDWSCEYTYGSGGALDISSIHDPNPFGTSNWDFVRAGWELIPFSFIFDWFVKVGDWLTNLRNIEVVYAQSYATLAIEAKTTISYPDWTMNSGNLEVKSFLMDRVIDLEPPRFPRVDKEWLNCIRTIDLISLAIGMLKGILRRRN